MRTQTPGTGHRLADGPLCLVERDRLETLFDRLETLPTPPTTYLELLDLSRRPNHSVADLARVISGDLAACAEVLKLVNSAYFGLTNTVTTVERAVALLGHELVENVALAAHVFSASRPLPPGLDAAALARHGMRTSLLARRITTAERWDHDQVSRVTLAALLHRVGLMVLATADPTGWQGLHGGPAGRPARQAEIDAFGVTVGEASALLLRRWGFPDPVVDLVGGLPIDLDDAGAVAGADQDVLLVAFAAFQAGGPSRPARPSSAAPGPDQPARAAPTATGAAPTGATPTGAGRADEGVDDGFPQTLRGQAWTAACADPEPGRDRGVPRRDHTEGGPDRRTPSLARRLIRSR